MVLGVSKWRFRWLVFILPVLLGLVVALWIVFRDDEPTLVGTDLGKQPAPDFVLTDQRGEEVRLSELRGKAVVLTFIYTNCPDVCLVTAQNLRVAYEGLPQNMRDRVALLAVTVDPARDTQAALQGYSSLHGLADIPTWHAMTGDAAVLERVWSDYGISPGMEPMAHDATATPAADYDLSHTDAIYVIDPQGRERVLMRSSLGPESLTDNLKALLN